MFNYSSQIKKIVISVSIFTLISCGDTGDIDDLEDGKELIVLTRNAPTTWYEGRDGPTGPEYDLVNSFASHYKLKVRFEFIDSIDEMLDAIRANKAHLGASGITITNRRKMNGVEFAKTYQKIKQLLVCRRGKKVPGSVEELTGLNLVVIDGSSYVETLRELKEKIPDLEWTVSNEDSTEQLLEKVWHKQIDCTLADSNIVSINRRYYPELVVAFPVTEDQPLAWILSPKWSGLKNDIDSWLTRIKDNGELATIMERYYGHIELYDYVDIKRFGKRIKKRLPKYKEQFKTAAKQYNLSWTLLAAQAYQESHWNPKARSPTGVRGMMMLTRNTAKSVNVSNRLDPVQSINGGAKYLRRMIKRIPEAVEENDRIWFALAAYNVGYGHLKDAQILAKRLGKNSNRWVDMKQVLPLLTVKKYYKTLKYGYARGTEPVQYVQRIREYQQILERKL